MVPAKAESDGFQSQGLIRRWGPALTFMALIYLISDQPKNGGLIPDLGALDFFLKKSAHFLEYGFLSILLLRGIRGAGAVTWKQLILAWIISVLYAATDEYHQAFVPGRTGRWQDVIIDGFGALLALLLMRWRCRSKSENES